MILRVGIVILALFGLFWFPWPLALVLIGVASMIAPVAGLVLGIATDLIFHPFVLGVMPYGTIVGIVGLGLGTVVRRFIESRIMGA